MKYKIHNKHICAFCFEVFKRSLSQVVGIEKFCSKTCQGRKRTQDSLTNAKQIGYYALHAWVKKQIIKPNECEKCGLIPSNGKDGRSLLDLANKSGEYRKDLEDWLWLCRKCHMHFDDVYGKRKRTRYELAR